MTFIHRDIDILREQLLGINTMALETVQVTRRAVFNQTLHRPVQVLEPETNKTIKAFTDLAIPVLHAMSARSSLNVTETALPPLNQDDTQKEYDTLQEKLAALTSIGALNWLHRQANAKYEVGVVNYEHCRNWQVPTGNLDLGVYEQIPSVWNGAKPRDAIETLTKCDETLQLLTKDPSQPHRVNLNQVGHFMAGVYVSTRKLITSTAPQRQTFHSPEAILRNLS